MKVSASAFSEQVIPGLLFQSEINVLRQISLL